MPRPPEAGPPPKPPRKPTPTPPPRPPKPPPPAGIIAWQAEVKSRGVEPGWSFSLTPVGPNFQLRARNANNASIVQVVSAADQLEAEDLIRDWIDEILKASQ